MVRLSDLIGKGKGAQPPPKPTPSPAAASPSPPAAPQRPTTSPQTPKPSLLAQPESSPEFADLEALYAQLMDAVKTLCAQARAKQPIQLHQASALLQQLPQTKTGRSETVLSLIERHTQENYLYSHAVNVGLLAYHLSLCLGYANSAARQLALAGLVHNHEPAQATASTPAAPKRVTEDEWKEISKDPSAGLDRLKESQELSRKALDAIGLQTDQQAPGGQADALQDATVLEYAKILAVCEMYDALTHPKTPQKRFSPAQTIKMLISAVTDQFDRRIVKALVDELSLYPRGSVVKLNTNEVGIVERVFAEAPLRPIVLVSRDANHQRLPTPRLVNLLERPFLYIKEIVSEEEL